MVVSMAKPRVQRLIADVMDIEGISGHLPGDGGGLTVFGLSERYHPEFIKKYRDGVSLSTLQELAGDIYVDEYLGQIHGNPWLMRYYPGLLWLLFFGKVHGTGDEWYTRALQEYLNNTLPMKGQPLLLADGQFGPNTLHAVKGMTALEKEGFLRFVTRQPVLDYLKAMRVEDVRAGGALNVERGIANRVEKEISYAYSIQQEAGFTQLSLWDSQNEFLEVKNAAPRGGTIDPGDTGRVHGEFA